MGQEDTVGEVKEEKDDFKRFSLNLHCFVKLEGENNSQRVSHSSSIG